MQTCELDNPCHNDGICYLDYQRQKLACVCPLQFSGPLCERRANKSCQMCLNGGVCVFGAEDESVRCECPEGLTGLNCEQGESWKYKVEIDISLDQFWFIYFTLKSINLKYRIDRVVQKGAFCFKS